MSEISVETNALSPATFSTAGRVDIRLVKAPAVGAFTLIPGTIHDTLLDVGGIIGLSVRSGFRRTVPLSLIVSLSAGERIKVQGCNPPFGTAPATVTASNFTCQSNLTVHSMTVIRIG